MPYSGVDDPKLPSNVKKLPKGKRKKWVATWNSVYSDCQKKGGEDCEGKAFRIANGTIEEANAQVTEQTAGSDFLFTDLSGYTGKPFDGLVPGVFIDMWGREVEIKNADLQVYVENTKDAIAHTIGESGEVVGLPIDSRDHNNGDAAGWIVDVSLEGEKVRFTPKWTDVGLDLIQRGLQRFFSATLQLADKVIVGGSLTNWPATRSKNGRILLRPVELSNNPHIYQLEAEETVADLTLVPEIIDGEETMNDELVQEVIKSVRSGLKDEIAQMLAELSAKPVEVSPEQPKMAGFDELIANLDLDEQKGELVEGVKAAMLAQYENLQEQARIEVARMLANVKRESDTAQFCAQVTGGTPDVPQGLPVKEDELKAWMLSLNPVQAQKAKEFLTQIWQNGLVGFSELGHSQEVERVQLPIEIQDALNKGILKVGDLSNETLGLGDISRYDLAKWK